MMIDRKTGFAPPELLSNIGPMYVHRKDLKDFDETTMQKLADYLDHLMDLFGETV